MGSAPPAPSQHVLVDEPLTRAHERPREVAGGSPSSIAALQPIAQHEQTWILACAPGLLVVIDQHRAHERVTYERLLRETSTQSLAPQPVTPVEVALPPALAALLVDNREALAVWGVALTPAVTGRIVVTAVPAPLAGADIEAVLGELASGLSAHQGQPHEHWREHMLAAVACHTSIQPGQALSLAEMQTLLGALAQCADTEVCPHGALITHVITTAALRQRFAPTR